MPGGEVATFILLPIGLGLFGFIEPCAIGSTLLFIKTTEGAPAAAKMAQVLAFTLSLAVFIGLLGALALHRLVYAIAPLGVLRFWWMVNRDIMQPAIFAAILALLPAYCVAARIRSTHRPKFAPTNMSVREGTTRF